MARKRLNALPAIPKDAAPSIRRWMEAVKESLEVRLGRRGDPGEAGVTFNDLVAAGLATPYKRINPETGLPEIGPPDTGDIDPGGPPPKPKGFTGLGYFGGVHLLWDRINSRPDITYTEIARSITIDREAGSLIGGSGGLQYLDVIAIPEAVTYFYWARHITYTGVVGPWSDRIQAIKPADVDILLERISGEITEEVLAPAFSQRLDGFSATLNDLGDQYTLTINNDGVIAGWTLYNTGQTSTFAVLAETFAIANELGAERYPFIVSDGLTYIDTAMIRQASIQQGQIGPISVGKITAADGTPITTVGGLIRANSIDTNNLHVAEATRFSGDVFSSDFRSGQRGWCLLQSGYVELNEAMIRGNLEVQSITVNGQSPFGALRVHGALSEWTETPSFPQDDGNPVRSWDHTQAFATSIAQMPKGSRLHMVVYPRLTASGTLSPGYSYYYPGTDEGTGAGTRQVPGTLRVDAYVRIIVYVDGAAVLNRTQQMINYYVNESTQATSRGGEMNGAAGGIAIEYTYPVYRASSQVRVVARVWGSASGDDGSTAVINNIIDGRGIVSGDVFRLG